MEKPICPKCGELMDRTEKNIREHPGEAALISLGAGFLLAQFPLRLLLTALTRAVLLVLKPTALLYGVFRLAEDFRERQAQAGAAPEERPAV